MTSRQKALTSASLAYKSLLTSEDPDNVYLDVLITNVGSFTTSPLPISFNEARQSAFLRKPEDYEMSIIRFQCDTSTLPVFIPVIQPNQNNVNLTVYSITMTYLPPGGGVTVPYIYQQPLIFVPQNTSVTVPPPPSSTTNGLQSPSSYYYYYNYQSFIYLVYEAFTKCFNALNALVPGGLPSTLAPTINWDISNNTAVIFCETPYYNTSQADNITPNPNNIRIYFNTPLYYLFNSFVFLNRGDSSSNGMNYELVVGSFGVNQVYIPVTEVAPAAKLCNALYQEYSTTSLWTPVSSLCFTTTLLPIVPTQLTAPLIYNELSVIQSMNNTNSPNANFINQITDIILFGDQYVPSVIYNPTAQYRFISMNGSQPLNQIDIQVYWKDRYGNFIPLTLESGGSCSLKIYFRKKRYMIQDKDSN